MHWETDGVRSFRKEVTPADREHELESVAGTPKHECGSDHSLRCLERPDSMLGAGDAAGLELQSCCPQEVGLVRKVIMDECKERNYEGNQ